MSNGQVKKIKKNSKMTDKKDGSEYQVYIQT